MAEPVLQLRQLGKSFGGLTAVSEVTLEVLPGDRQAVIGPNGAGKTTLFNLITGVFRPDSGQVVFAGQDITAAAPHRRCHAGIARTFQLVRPFAALSVLHNVVVGRIYGHESTRDRRRAEGEARDLLDLVGLAARAADPAHSLTLIDRKRLELARALATSPRLLLLDEFMAGLNPAETATAMALIRTLVREGLTVLMVEHIVWALMELSRRIVVLSAGEKIAEGPPDAIAADPAVVDVYLGTDRGSPTRA